jgi:hypothetical protein
MFLVWSVAKNRKIAPSPLQNSTGFYIFISTQSQRVLIIIAVMGFGL